MQLSPTFPYLQQLDIIIRIDQALAGVEKNILALSLKAAIKNQQPARTIISNIQDMIEDNSDLIADLLGVELTNRIKDLNSAKRYI